VIVLDTHVWLWVVIVPGRLSRTARRAIDRAPELGVATISFWEIALLDRLGRIRLDRSARSWARGSLAADPRMVALPLTPEIALAAGELSAISEPGDSVIYATAVEHDAMLVSRDQRLLDLDPARVVW